MVEPFEPQRFNDDLLMHPDDRGLAQRSFPRVMHVLDDDDMRVLLRGFDDPANRAKKRSHAAGLIAVVMAVVGLCGTSAELFRDLEPAWLGLVFALFGILGVVIGLGGVMIWNAKKRWLYCRMVGERIRQFHFQTMVCRVSEIAASLKGDAERSRFLDERKAWLAEFALRFPHHMESEFTALLHNEEQVGVWLHPPPWRVDDAALAALPPEFFTAYRSLRLRHQIQYAEYKLRHGQGVLAGLSQARQEAILETGSLVATLLLFAIELVSVIVPLRYGEASSAWPSWLRDTAPWAHWLALCSAIVALGLRTLEDGLQPKREVERYHWYRLAIQDILRRFDQAAEPRQKWELMVEMEQLSFEEMRDFLRSNFASRFVM